MGSGQGGTSISILFRQAIENNGFREQIKCAFISRHSVGRPPIRKTVDTELIFCHFVAGLTNMYRGNRCSMLRKEHGSEKESDAWRDRVASAFAITTGSASADGFNPFNLPFFRPIDDGLPPLVSVGHPRIAAQFRSAVSDACEDGIIPRSALSYNEACRRGLGADTDRLEQVAAWIARDCIDGEISQLTGLCGFVSRLLLPFDLFIGDPLPWPDEGRIRVETRCEPVTRPAPRGPGRIPTGETQCASAVVGIFSTAAPEPPAIPKEPPLVPDWCPVSSVLITLPPKGENGRTTVKIRVRFIGETNSAWARAEFEKPLREFYFGASAEVHHLR